MRSLISNAGLVKGREAIGDIANEDIDVSSTISTPPSSGRSLPLLQFC